MIFKFSRKKFSDVVKVVAYLDAEKIEYEVLTDIEVALGGASTPAPVSDGADPDAGKPKMVPTVEPIRTGAVNGLWKPAQHDGKVCQDTACLSNAHQGAQPLGA